MEIKNKIRCLDGLIMMHHDEVLIRVMNHNDFTIMVKWLNDSRVLEFYEESPASLEKVTKKYGPRIEGRHYVKPCVVEYKNKPVGYIQYYEIQENDLKIYGYPQNHDIYGIDQFIGEVELWGKGIGTSMIFLMLNYLNNHKNASRVVLEVKNHNMRAISCYKKCGFRKIKDINDDTSLMKWEK